MSIHEAARNCNARQMRRALDAGASPNDGSYHGQPPLLALCYLEPRNAHEARMACLDLLRQSPGFDVNATDIGGAGEAAAARRLEEALGARARVLEDELAADCPSFPANGPGIVRQRRYRTIHILEKVGRGRGCGFPEALQGILWPQCRYGHVRIHRRRLAELLFPHVYRLLGGALAQAARIEGSTGNCRYDKALAGGVAVTRL